MRTLVAAMIVAGAAPAAASIVTPTSGFARAGVEVRLTPLGTSVDGPNGTAWTTLAPGTAYTGSASRSLATAGDAVAASSSIRAVWSSASAGSIRLDWGWTSSGNAAKRVQTYLFEDPSRSKLATGWSYSFSLGAPAQLRLAYDTATSGDLVGLQPPLLFINSEGPNYLGGFVDPNGSGTAWYLLPAGTVRLDIVNFGNWEWQNLPANGTFDPLNGSATSSIDWSLQAAPIPEPGTWAMMIVGFGLVGAAMRRRGRASRPGERPAAPVTVGA